MSCINTQLSCCFGGRSCRLCCRFLPVAYESTTARLMYIFYLMTATAFMCLSLSVPYFKKDFENKELNFSRVCQTLNLGTDCDRLSGYLAVYRISLAVTGFFAIMAMFTLGIQNSQGWRAKVHNGFWIIKFLVISAMAAGAFYIPEESVKHFEMYWMYIALGGAILFVIIQLWLLVAFARGLSRSVRLRVQNGGSSWVWYGMSVGGGVLGFCICLVGIFFLLANYTAWKNCTKNKLFIGINGALIVICSVVALLPCSRKPDMNIKSGLLQLSIMALYILYLTWSALSSEPMEPIPDLSHLTVAELTSRNATSGRGRALFEIEGVTDDQMYYCGPDDDPDSWVNRYLQPYIPYVGVVVMFFTVIYSSLGTSASQARDLGVTGLTVARRRHKQNVGCWRRAKGEWRCVDLIEDDGGQRIIRNEKDGVIYSYSLFHAIFALATMYIMVQLTGWIRPGGSDLANFNRNWDTVWVKMCTSWACAVIYLISLMLPAQCFQGRDGVRVSATDEDLQLPDR